MSGMSGFCRSREAGGNQNGWRRLARRFLERRSGACLRSLVRWAVIARSSIAELLPSLVISFRYTLTLPSTTT
jgi:hypothetical protein